MLKTCVSVKLDSLCLLVVEFVEVLHVSKDDVLFVDDSRWNLFDPARHLPQVGLCDKMKPKKKSFNCFMIRFHIYVEKLLCGSGVHVKTGRWWWW